MAAYITILTIRICTWADDEDKWERDVRARSDRMRRNAMCNKANQHVAP